MCGIAGHLAFDGRHGTDVPDAIHACTATARMTAAMRARGPDAEGLWAEGPVTLGHRRLAIVDLAPQANQPMHSACGRYTIVFNGEIYNHRELRNELAAVGTRFRTWSDTEVLLALFAREGERMLDRLRGMFAFAIWDAHARCLFLARDPCGIKPLYYARAPEGFTFASQVRALLASGLVAPAPEPAGIAGFYLWGSVPEPWTLHHGVLQLPAGHWLKVGADPAPAQPEPVQWHDVRAHWRGAGESLPASELQARVRAQLTDTVAAHLVADVPVCIFLSGGVDSAVIAALACELGVRPLGITLAFDEFDGRIDDESAGAAAVANAYGMAHVVRRVTRAEFEQDLPRILAAMDQPTIDGVNTWFAAKAAAEHGFKVALSGVGGDELFCGYPSFRQLVRAECVATLARQVPGARTLLGSAARAWGAWQGQPKHALTGELMHSLEGLYYLRRGLFMPTELDALMPGGLAEPAMHRLGGALLGLEAAGARDTLAGVSALESTQYLRNQLLRDSDWASMAHGVELRTPLVDVRLLAALAPCGAAFADGAGKRMQAAAPSPPLPRLVRDRPKTGFGLPMSQWLGSVPPGNPPTFITTERSHWSRRWAWHVMHADGQCESRR